MNIQSLTELLNTIRDNSSAGYQERIPEATQDNLDVLRGVFADEIDGVDFANEFTSALINKYIKTKVHMRMFNNPMAIFKKGKKPLGDTVEEIFVNYAKADAYDPTGVNLLARNLPDVKAVYHKENRKDVYKVTINRTLLLKAFNSYSNLDSFIKGIINSLYNGASLDEYNLMRELMSKAIDDGYAKVIPVSEPIDSADNGTAFIKTVKTISSSMEFPSDQFNGYTEVQDTDTTPIITFTPKENQYIILDVPTNVALDVDVLAKAFNIGKQEFMAKVMVIESFTRSEVRAVIVDEEFFQIYDDLFYFNKFTNEEGLYDNYMLHVHQTIAYSPLVNAIALSVGSDQDTDANTDVDVFDVTYTLDSGITVTNDRAEVIEGGSLGTTVKVADGTTLDTVVVTMATVDVTSSVYNSSTGKITVDAIDGDIVITATAV